MRKILAIVFSVLMLVTAFPIAEASNHIAATKDAPPAGYVNVTLTAQDVWGDGTGYQMLFDADHTAFGTIIPLVGPLTNWGDVSQDIYDQFEYKIPENADGAITTQNIVLNSSVTIQIPAGIYDYCITNPTPSTNIMWIAAGDNGKGDNFLFCGGYDYMLTVARNNETGNDRVFIEKHYNDLIPPTPAPKNLMGMNTTDLQGNVVTDSIFAENNLTIFNMWANWCNPCIGELPALQQLWENYEKLGVKVIGVLCEGTAAQGLALLNNANAKYQNIFPDNVITSQILDTMEYYPTTYFINNEGVIMDQYTEIGANNYAGYSQIVSGILDDLGFPSDPNATPGPTTDPTPTPAVTPTPVVTPTSTPINTPVQTPTPTPTPTYVIGDVNMDNVLNTGDAALILSYLAKQCEFTEEQMLLADYNADQMVNTGDAAGILRFLAGLN